MKHTPTPWQVYNNNAPMKEQRCTIIADIDGEYENGRASYTYKFCAQTLNEFAEGDEHAEANAARIVACVNACEGISNEALDAGVIAKLRKSLMLAVECDSYDADGFPAVWLEDASDALAKLGQTP